jgi:Flp pilus assembly protein TadG
VPRSNRCAERRRPTHSRLVSARAADDRGSASLEFLTAGMLLLVPLVYLVLALGAIQSAALATEGAARQAARVFVQAESTAAGTAAAERALTLALADHGVSASEAALSIRCSPVPGQCHTRRGWVTVEVTVRVPLPLLPPVAEFGGPLAVPIDASATQQVSRFWGAR